MKAMIIGAFVWILVLLVGCDVPIMEKVSSTTQAATAVCLPGQNPWTASYPNRTTCTWQPTPSITPAPTSVEYCAGTAPPNDRCDVFDAPFTGGTTPPYATANCARVIVPTGAIGWTFSYNAMLGNGWLTPSTWIRSVYCGVHVRDMTFSKNPCLTCGSSASNGGWLFQIADVTGQFGADMQIASFRVRQVSP